MEYIVIAETERLRIRQFTEEDLESYFQLGHSQEVTRYTGTGQLQSREQALEILRKAPLSDYRTRGYGRWACELKSSGEVVGFAGFKFLKDRGEVDLGYWFLPEVWGQGLASEAVRTLLSIRGRFGIESVVGLVHPENAGSIAVLKKNGFEFRAEEQDEDGVVLVYMFSP